MRNTVLMVAFVALCACSQVLPFKKHHLEDRSISMPDRSLKFQVQSETSKLKAKSHLVYYWVLGNELHHSQGGYEGKLLHGHFSAFYPDRQLKTQGAFFNGLKHGHWKQWSPNGYLKTSTAYQRGLKHGRAQTFDDHGHLVSEQSFKNGVMHGASHTYKAGNVVSSKRFKNGVEVIEPEELEIVSPAKQEADTSQHLKWWNPKSWFRKKQLETEQP